MDKRIAVDGIDLPMLNIIRFDTWYKPQRIREYVPFAVFLETVEDMISQVVRELRGALPDRFFTDPITSGNVIIPTCMARAFPESTGFMGRSRIQKALGGQSCLSKTT